MARRFMYLKHQMLWGDAQILALVASSRERFREATGQLSRRREVLSVQDVPGGARFFRCHLSLPGRRRARVFPALSAPALRAMGLQEYERRQSRLAHTRPLCQGFATFSHTAPA
ncbi:hypothetical protein CHU95_03505 [Niveispirillum lacus]|uniref:Uncharacterized protein n=1 Tax=Niveispirillum lacus TaxID=1981099 RepID=A0A255Z5N3_9PROT|nr:hypothetical protein CHU95_03505 [Niveispirillum lacus]